ncbi:hypothetical protein BDB00DRAFT_847561 [Zychaea mexicana]|uniref:uncharacterized protein n=1 Tax=Zychaea mexicana TaxID=64656 RepID=UPI0022FDE0DE|nr:uncharacterized protein BDB00DRAFT_847561 [Zychaea mexicana]KAI9488603.1 hypothetical protein BDB00DRAFT_847561 [Zychaea mexicana]
MTRADDRSPPRATVATIVELVVADGVAVAATETTSTTLVSSVDGAGGTLRKKSVVSEDGSHHHLCLSYPDMSIHVARHTLLDFVSTLRHRPDASMIVVANIDVHGNYIDFGLPSQRVLCTPNAGGPSIMSEAMSAELIDRLVGIRNLLTETEVQYTTKGPITDYACYSVSTSQALGVSVTRAMAFGRRFTARDAIRLMKKKINGINKSTKTVSNYKFERQILHVWAATGTDAAIVRRACAKIPDHIRNNTIILITTINMDSVFASN